MDQKIKGSLQSRYPADVVETMLTSYTSIHENFLIGKWKPAELDAGHFVECVRRVIENELFGVYQPLGKSLNTFNEKELVRYLNAKGDESFRILIPRALWSIYGLRNKRGVGHIGPVSANKMDATHIVYVSKWILAELLRLSSSLSPDDTQEIIDQIIERELELVYETGSGKLRVLSTDLSTPNQVLLLLYARPQMTFEELLAATEYKRRNDFKKVIKKMHKKRFIEFDEVTNLVEILPPGIIEAEKISVNGR